MNEINERNEEYFKSVWLPLITSLLFSIVQSTEISYNQMFFDIDFIQLIDTFTICIYAAIIPARIVPYIDKSKPFQKAQFLLWFAGAGLYVFDSFVKIPFGIIILFISLLLGLSSYRNLKNYLTKGNSNENTEK